MKKIYLEGQHYYDYEVENGIHVLYYSNSDDGWSLPFRGQIAMTLQDDGDDFFIPGAGERIQYDVAEQMFILLKLALPERKLKFRR